MLAGSERSRRRCRRGSEFLDGREDGEFQSCRRILVTEPTHPYVAAGPYLGWEHSFTHEVKDLVEDLAAGRDPVPSFEDGLQVQLVLDAVQRPAADRGRWTEVGA